MYGLIHRFSWLSGIEVGLKALRTTRLVYGTHRAGENPNHREFLLIELKRPSLTIGKKEMDQLQDYVNAILAQPDFINTSTQWNFYLVTSEYDSVVKERITQENRPMGLFIDKPNHKVWIKSWSALIRDCDARLKFVQDKLRIEVSAEETQERIARLKASVLKTDVVEVAEAEAGSKTGFNAGRSKKGRRGKKGDGATTNPDRRVLHAGDRTQSFVFPISRRSEKLVGSGRSQYLVHYV